MFALVRLLIAFGSVQSPDVVCVDAADRAACVEDACRMTSGLDYDVTECDGLADHLRSNPPAYWQLADECKQF